MSAFEQAIRFVNVFAAAVVAGGQLVVLLVIVPTKREFEPRVSVLVHNAMLGHQIDRFMKPSGIVSGLAALALLALHFGNVIRIPPLSIAATLIGIVGTAGVVVTSRFFNVRTNRMMSTWSLDAIPENYPEVRNQWDLVHSVRASCGVLP